MSHHFLPHEVWILLDQHFYWSDHAHVYSPEDLHHNHRYILSQIKQEIPLGYGFFHKNQTLDFEKYLEYREEAFFALSDENVQVALQRVGKAKEIFAEDPDLLRIEGQCYMYLEDIPAAIVVFEQLLNIHPADRDARYMQTVVDSKSGMISSLDDIEKLMLLAESYQKYGALEKAREIYQRLLAIVPDHLEAKNSLAQIFAQMKRRLNKALENEPGNEEFQNRLKLLDQEIRDHYTGNSSQNQSGKSQWKRIWKPSILLFIIIVLVFKLLIYNAKIHRIFDAPASPVPLKVTGLNEWNIGLLGDNPLKSKIKFTNVKPLSLLVLFYKDQNGESKTKFLEMTNEITFGDNVSFVGRIFVGSIGRTNIAFVADLNEDLSVIMDEDTTLDAVNISATDEMKDAVKRELKKLNYSKRDIENIEVGIFFMVQANR